ncbi:hypothetical protein [Butyrivibrio sp. X503]|uniref:hypothetical protein n=1 Tax=Butyrivibrio sp. X503 TaxID=2364878 RepID=UPI0011C2284D|nr:hypothetical protein [Butyrivibrio sp. X503]
MAILCTIDVLASGISTILGLYFYAPLHFVVLIAEFVLDVIGISNLYEVHIAKRGYFGKYQTMWVVSVFVVVAWPLLFILADNDWMQEFILAGNNWTQDRIWMLLCIIFIFLIVFFVYRLKYALNTEKAINKLMKEQTEE